LVTSTSVTLEIAGSNPVLTTKIKCMKKYYLTIIGGSSSWDEVLVAETFYTTTNNSTSSGYYAFHKDKELVACYPIDRTIITKIEKI
jgi:hypothetical protein